jgi:DNA invertase Pin-like site-specific DNA recombinase
MESATTKRRAVGIVRCSPDDNRGGDTKHSPAQQADQITAHCRREGWELLDIHEEEDISGRWKLERRPGLRAAIEAIENDDADLVIVSRFDRLVRSVRVQAEITERVEKAGGDLFAIDSGFLTNGNATQRLSSNFLGMVAQYHADTTQERTWEALERAVANGIPVFAGATAGYLRPVIGKRPNGTPIHGPLVPDPATKDTVVKAWEMRADGATVSECRAFLAEHGIEYSYPGVIKLFKSRLPLGELHHGNLENLYAHPAIIDRDLWQRVQDMRSPRGRQAKSQRLLSRLGVLRCKGCGGRMSVGDDWRGSKVYRCSTPAGNCLERSTIMADVADAKVWAEAVIAAEELRGRAVDDERVAAAEVEADRAEQALEGLVAMLTGLEAVAGVRERVLSAQAEAKRLRARANRLALSVSGASEDVDPRDPRLSLKARRGIVRWAIREAVVCRSAPGLQGAARITVDPFQALGE